MRGIQVRTTYYGPTDTRGSRIRVSRVGRGGVVWESRLFAYDYAAPNPHLAAVGQWCVSHGFDPDLVAYSRGTRTGRGSVYRVIPGDLA